MKEYLEYLIKNIVSKPKEVNIEEIREDDSYIYKISVDQSDMGMIIGKGGRTIKSIREMAKIKAIKDNIRVDILLNEEDEKI